MRYVILPLRHDERQQVDTFATVTPLVTGKYRSQRKAHLTCAAPQQ
jgi:hypothetical protein